MVNGKKQFFLSPFPIDHLLFTFLSLVTACKGTRFALAPSCRASNDHLAHRLLKALDGGAFTFLSLRASSFGRNALFRFINNLRRTRHALHQTLAHSSFLSPDNYSFKRGFARFRKRR